MVKLELYRVFREVAEAGNISLAAENLYLSQSAVSQSVKQDMPRPVSLDFAYCGMKNVLARFAEFGQKPLRR